MSVAPVLLFVVVFEVERVVFVVVPVSVGVHVVGTAGVMVERFVVVFVLVVGVTGGAVETTPEQFFGGCEAVVRFEVVQVALHDVDEESDGISAVGCFELDDVCDALVEAGFAGGG